MATSMTRRGFVETAAGVLSVSLVRRPSVAALAPFAELNRPQDAMDRDLLEITIPRLHALYEAKKYTTTQVTRWYLDRIARYDSVYRAVSHTDARGALATAAALDAAAARSGSRFTRGSMWGVPIVIKANTSVKGLVTSNGWWGYVIPGRELVAPADATVVAKLRAAGAIILGQTNMPDFAASDATFSTVYGRTGNAYDPRFSPGGSSGGTVTAVAANFCVLGTGTDTGNSIRMPASTSALVGVLPTRGLVSIAGIHPLDWLLDNTGPIARSVTDAAIALDVMAGADAKDFRTKDAPREAQAGPYAKSLKSNALEGKRFGVPTFIVNGSGGDGVTLSPDTRALFMNSLDELRKAGATIVIDDAILPDTFPQLVRRIDTNAYAKEGTITFLRDYGPAQYHSPAEYARAVGTPLGGFQRGNNAPVAEPSTPLQSDPRADERFWGPQRAARAAYDETLDRLHLDGYVYPAAQMPPNDEIASLAEGRRSSGPHSNTAWVNPIGVPAVVVPGGFYANRLPFGIELSAKRWRDGDLLGWAFAYEQATKHRAPPTLVTKG